MSESRNYGVRKSIEAINEKEDRKEMKAQLFVELSSGVVKKTTMDFSPEMLLTFGAQMRMHNPRCRVYIKQNGVMQEIE